MVAQPQQPIYPDQLRFELDRQYGRITDYGDARYEKIVAQMRVDKQESIARDNELRNAIVTLIQRVSNVEATQQTIIDMQREIISAQQNLVAAQQNIVATLQSLQQQVSDGFAAQAERHNELMVRVERLERGNPPPATES